MSAEPRVTRVGPVSYSVTADGLRSLGLLTQRVIGRRPLIVAAGRRALRLAGTQALPALERAGYRPQLIVLPEGERFKTLEQARALWDQLLARRVDRETALLSLGGGGISDLVGFVASTTLRGLPVIQAPTTLLAQVDAGLGGKTAVNHPLGKNLIGTFWRPELSVMDVNVLSTLAPRQVRNGMAEAIKTVFLDGTRAWNELDRRLERIIALDGANLEWIVKKCCNIKARVVTVDERETQALNVRGQGGSEAGRLALNLGHTVGHALEIMPRKKRLQHGEAVALGLRFAARMAWEWGVCARELPKQLEGMLDRAGLPKAFPRVSWTAVADIIAGDKKRRGGPEGSILWVLPERIGQVRVVPIAVRELYDARLKAVFENGGKDS